MARSIAIAAVVAMMARARAGRGAGTVFQVTNSTAAMVGAAMTLVVVVGTVTGVMQALRAGCRPSRCRMACRRKAPRMPEATALPTLPATGTAMLDGLPRRHHRRAVGGLHCRRRGCPLCLAGPRRWQWPNVPMHPQLRRDQTVPEAANLAPPAATAAAAAAAVEWGTQSRAMPSGWGARDHGLTCRRARKHGICGIRLQLRCRSAAVAAARSMKRGGLQAPESPGTAAVVVAVAVSTTVAGVAEETVEAGVNGFRCAAFLF